MAQRPSDSTASGAAAAVTEGRPRDPGPLLGSSEAFAAFRAELERVAASPATVLIAGESGVGKGLAAAHLHARSSRREGPLVVAALAAVAPTLLEAALFGHERGAFTDAHRSRLGLFQRASGGTLVLDDVDLLPLGVQGKLLRVLQERVVEPLGAEAPVPVDVRIVATTHKDLAAEVEAERFRLDLYYRIAVVPLAVPPLRARPGDLDELVPALIERVARRLGVPARPVRDEALARLRAHAWPGNVRELENALERVHALGGGGATPVAAAELAFLAEPGAGIADELAREALGHGLGVQEMTTAMMRQALAEQRGNVSRAARQVGLTRRAFEYRLARADAGADDGGAGEEEA